MSWRFFLKEATRALQRNAAPSIAALITVMITTLVLGVFIPVTDATTGAANEIRSRLEVEVFLKDSASQTDITALRTQLKGLQNTKSVVFISKNQAKASQSEALKNAADLLGKNPYPASFRVTPRDAANIEAIAAALGTTNAKGVIVFSNPAIDSVSNRKNETDKILAITSGVKYTMWALAFLLMLASTVLVANTIRLSVYARRRDIEVMRLVGATDWFIRWPFVIEGVVVGLSGGLIAVLLLAIAKQTIIDPLSRSFALFAAPETISFSLLVVVMLLASTLMAALGSGFTLRRFLRV